MTVPIALGTAGFLARYEALRCALPGMPGAREAAAEAFRAAGLPGAAAGRRPEAWKYTPLRALAETGFVETLSVAETDAAVLPRLAENRLVFLDGRFRAELSEAVPGIVSWFAAEPEFGTLARPERDPLVALNTMLAQDGARIEVPDGFDAGVVQIASHSAAPVGTAMACHPRHLIRLGAGARLVLLETIAGTGRYLHNPVTEIVLGSGAELVHVRLQEEGAESFHLATLYAALEDGARYEGFTLNLGARLARTEIHACLAGPGAHAGLHAAQLLGGVRHADVTTVVRHEAPRGTSRQAVRSVLTGRARGVFQGRIEVARAAQKTDGYQMSQALLLSDEAEIDTKPELEIFADDVKCSHGATVGALDPDQLFYLRARGVAEREARAILVRAFLDETLAEVAHDGARAALDEAIGRAWQREAA
ncbi:MAG: Fe-S cluster assembly protein SufD [Rhodospirillales bacterium]|nr:Fe-S cluster assembly protein SufD [Rhodospirillales bacterium]